MANVYDPKAIIQLPGRSRFDLSYRNSFTTKMGLEIPVTCEPIYPGDRIRYSLTYQMQLAPLLNPVYDGLEVNFEAFFVPNRILDMRWKEFWTGYNEYDQMTPSELAPLTMGLLQINHDMIRWNEVPKTEDRVIGIGSLLDFCGFQFSSYFTNGLPYFDNPNPSATAFNLDCNALPLLAYNRIYDDWYRNERTQRARLYDYYNNTSSNVRSFASSYELNDDGSLDTSSVYANKIPLTLFKRNYKKDRFTTALPEPVIGGDVHIPVNPDPDLSTAQLLNTGGIDVSDASTGSIAGALRNQTGSSLNVLALGTIEQLKLAFKEYTYRMKDTYNGNRYNESIESHYGIRVPDSTVQRSYYLGSSRDYVSFGEVYQTSSGDGQGTNGALGDFAGRGGSAGTHYLFDETFYEHGFLFVLMCVNPISRYYQGVKRYFTRFDRSEYFEPEFQNIGDDFINVSELYNPTSSDLRDQVFGYNSRWVELKTRYNELHGDFANSNASNPLNNWNFARAFGSVPTISSEFSEVVPINKPFVDSDRRNDNYFVDIAIDMQALRPILATESF